MVTTAARITVGLIPKAVEALDWLAQRTGMTKTDLVNRAVQLYRFTEESQVNGAYLALVHADGSHSRVTVL